LADHFRKAGEPYLRPIRRSSQRFAKKVLVAVEAQVDGTSTDSILTRYNSLRRKKWQISE
jgi:hypothetical protein